MSRPLIAGLGLMSLVLVALSVVLDLTVHKGMTSHEMWTNALWTSAWILGGLIAWARRPHNLCGPLMALTGWAFLVPHLAFYDPVSYTVTQVLGNPGVAFLVHLLVVFPEGRLRTRFEKVVVSVNYAGWIVVPAFGTMWDTGGCSDCPDNLLFIRDDPRLVAVALLCMIALITFGGVSAAVLLIRRWRHASRPGRRVLAPVVWTSLVGLVIWVAWLVPTIWLLLPPDNVYSMSMFIATYVLGAAVPLAFLAGLLRTRLRGGWLPS